MAATSTATTSSTSSRTRSKSEGILSSTEEISPRANGTANNLLEFLDHHSDEELDFSPAAMYCCYQLKSTIKLYLAYTKDNKTRKYDDICDLIKNLIQLHKNMMERYPEVAQRFSKAIYRFLVSVDELNAIIERGTQRIVTNWRSIGHSIIEKSKSCLPLSIMNIYTVPRIQDFTVQSLLTSGYFGATYSAIFKPANVQCHVRVLSHSHYKNETKQVFVDKIIASIINNKHLIHYHAAFIAHEAFVTVTEHFESIDTNQILISNRSCPFHLFQYIAIQLVEGLKHLHLCGCMHRDVKPSNILINKVGEIKLTNYDAGKIGLGHHLRRIIPIYFCVTKYEFHTKEPFGTKHYLAPEVISLQKYGRSAEWWAMGVTLFKLCTGLVPFRGFGKSLLVAISETNHQWPNERISGYTDDSIAFISELLIKNPAERLGSKNYKDFNDNSFLKSAAPLLESDVHHAYKVISNRLSRLSGGGETNNINHRLNLKNETNLNLHKSALTYSSKTFKQLLDHINEEGHVTSCVKCVKIFKKEEPSLPQFDYSQTQDTEDLTGELKHVEAKTRQIETLLIDIRLKRKSENDTWGFNTSVVDTINPRIKCLFVANVNENTPASKAGLLYGDIIYLVNGKHSHDVAEFKTDKNKLKLSVFTSNSFRVLILLPNLALKLRNVRSNEVTLQRVSASQLPPELNPFGFSTFTVTAARVNNQCRHTEVINAVHSSVKDSKGAPTPILVGDILVSVPGVLHADNKTSQEIAQLVSGVTTDTLTMRIIPFSVLRGPSFLVKKSIEDILAEEHRQNLTYLCHPESWDEDEQSD